MMWVLYINSIPVFLDAGVGTYTRKTFSSERYSIWTMQSNYHNLPMINGVPEHVAVRYAIRNYSNATLFNCFGVPASPFRSDDW